jgi:hypothetical protein
VWPRIRDIAVFIGGFGFAIHEIVLSPPPSMPALVLAAGMMGLPGAFHAEQQWRARQGEDDKK